MNDEAPIWNKDDPAESLRIYAQWLNDLARKVFLQDKTHIEIFFLLDKMGKGGVVPYEPGADRDTFLANLKANVQHFDIYAVLHIAESWSYFPRQPNDHTMKQLAMGEMNVSDLRSEERKECLMVRCESRPGYQNLWLNPIVRKHDGVALADAIEIADAPGGRCGHFFGPAPNGGRA